MTRHLWALLVGLALVLALLVVGPARADKDKEDDPELVAAGRTGVLKLVDLNAKGDADALKKEAASLQDKVDLKYVMKTLALRSDKGIGVGDKPGAITPDGIEAKLINISNKAMAPKNLADQANDLARSADILIAVAEVALATKKPPKKAGGTPAKWQEFSKDMKEAAQKLSVAAKAKKPEDVLAAAQALYSSCTECHKIWKN